MPAKYISVFKTRSPLPLLQPFLSFTRSRKFSFSEFSTDKQQQHNSFTVTYLVNSCGLSPESAISASRRVKFEDPHKPDSVLNLLRNHGFTKIQISKLVINRPGLLLASPEKTLLPKLQFFKSIGVSETDLPRTLTSAPYMLSRSLNQHIIPCFNHLKNLLGSDVEAITALSRTWGLLSQAHSKHLLPNIDLLKQIGVPNSCVVLLLKHYPEVLTRRNNEFVDIVEQVKEMGFDPTKTVFVLAVHAISGGNKATWERCYEMYTSWGWSKDEIMMAFRKHPNCMMSSKKKLMQGMRYLVDEMGWPAHLFAKFPCVLLLSLEKRIKPRCSVLKVLNEKGVITKDDVSLTSLLLPAEHYFLEKYVNKYLEQVPELLRIYEEQVSASGISKEGEEL